MQIIKFMSMLSLSLFALTETSAISAANEIVEKRPHCSPYVIPPGTDLNEYKLILVLGQDDPLEAPAATAPTLLGFTDMLGWDNAKITQYREAAIDWFLERFGIDFNGGTLDPNTGVLIGPNQDMAMVPILYHGDYRVISSTRDSIPPYSDSHPSSVAIAQYTAVFFTTPTYGGTFANGTPIVGNPTDYISYATYSIFLNCKGTKKQIIFARSFYPSTSTPNRFPTLTPSTGSDRLQLFSEKYGPGYSFVNARDALTAIDGVFPTNATNTMLFPGTRLNAYDDWNGFTVAPVSP